MRKAKIFQFLLILFLSFQIAVPPGLLGQGAEGPKPFTQEELDQLLAPIALHPDSLLAQILMASTYPLEVVQADRWAKQNKNLKGDALAAALEKQTWDPSVKSLVNFPQALQMMSEKLDWTQKLGDAFIGQEKEVMQTVQKLRKKAEEQGNLKTTKEQKVTVEQETKVIIIEPADPQVIYVPTYNPTVVYGTWWYPAPPPYYYYPPGYAAGGALFAFGVGVAVGAAWGYAWGGCGWGRNEVNVDIDRNTTINNNIDRDKYKNEMKNKGQVNAQGQGKFQHDPSHRKGVSYRDQATAQKYNRGASADASKARDSYRGKGEQGKQDLARGGGDQVSDRSGGERGSERGDRDSAFGGSDRGSEVRQQSDRGSSSRESMSSGGKGPGSGGSRGGGGGGRGGGGRR
ncbi:MAG: hypothetical protein H6Q42_2124 [Deltaproteobacteria bacterium]|nr:hypothetical protein [Deltaproteobacteria bacterium]